MKHYTRIHEADDVTNEIITIAQGVHDGWFNDGQRIDWQNFFDRVDGALLADDSILDVSEDMESGAIKKIKREIRAYRKLEA